MSPSPSFKKYLQQHADDFRVVSFYEKYDFESRAMAETALCQTVKSVISKGTKSRKLTLLCTLLSGNSYEILKCPKVEAYWAQIEAEQMFHLAFMTRVKCRALSKLAEARKELANHEKTSR